MNIVSIILPLVLIASLGFICAKSQWLSRTQIDALSKFTFYLSIPAFLFYQMAKADLSKQVSPQLFAAFYLPVLGSYGLAMLTHYFFNKCKSNTNGAAAVFALGGCYSNTVIVGLPILLQAVGEQAVGITFLIITFHSLLLFALTSAIAARSSSKYFNWFHFLKQNIKNPLVLSILLGLTFNLLSIELPYVIQDTLALLGKTSHHYSLIYFGSFIKFLSIKYKVRISLTRLYL